MGVLFTKLWHRLFGEEEYKIVVIGLNNAGKTTILYALNLGEVVLTQPTIGSNVEEVRFNNINFVVWDIGGQESLRATWENYYSQTSAIIMVVDSTDVDRFELVKHELFHALEHTDLKDSVVLVLANKQDMPSAMPAGPLTEHLNLHQITDHEWHLQTCCALTGDGLYEGLNWIVDRLQARKKSGK
eukprot:NODE_4506_length_793_cov_5.379032_g3741_i0.p1 GENE.NODE_4506_length_793_cov_5.379032_g3741_i0~~NODE_4506_length_793_cov_5.379032_g3741_i0.p1  ORF type:complete len:186 (+),score=40.80 NODE_4506_length_793_cov_5.379032_g3741_i0:139-696(+)